MSTIGSRIRSRRTDLKMTQDELAKKLGYKSRSSINKIELSERKLTQSKIKAIADALDTTPSYIMGWEPSPGAETKKNPPAPMEDSLNDKELALIRLFRALPAPQQELVFRMLEALSIEKD